MSAFANPPAFVHADFPLTAPCPPHRYPTLAQSLDALRHPLRSTTRAMGADVLRALRRYPGAERNLVLAVRNAVAYHAARQPTRPPQAKEAR